MRRQDAWLDLADRLEISRVEVVAACVFLNLRRTPQWIAKQLALPISKVEAIAEAAKPLLRQSRRETIHGERVCVYCGTDRDITKDHIIPSSRGGSSRVDNLAWCCRNCNSAKGNRTPQEWLR